MTLNEIFVEVGADFFVLSAEIKDESADQDGYPMLFLVTAQGAASDTFARTICQ